MSARLALVALVSGLVACVDLSKPRAFQCDPGGVTLDEPVRQSNCRSTPSTRWYCALDGYCRDATTPTTRECQTDEHCPSNHRCGPTQESLSAMRCRPVEQTSAFLCRADAGDVDCGPGWRCAFDGVCRARAGAPASCRVDADCDDGWRCGRAGRCSNPVSQELFPTTTPGPAVRLNPLVDFFGDGEGPFLVSPPVALADGGTQRIVVRHEVARAVLSAGDLVSSVALSPVTLNPGSLRAVSPQLLAQARGSSVELSVLGSPDASFGFNVPGEVLALRALNAIDGAWHFASVLDGGRTTSVELLGPTARARLVFDGGVRLVGATTLGTAPDCAVRPLVAWSTDTLYAWAPDGGFTAPTTTVVQGPELQHVALDELLNSLDVFAERRILEVVPGPTSLALLYGTTFPTLPVEGVDAGVTVVRPSLRVAALRLNGCAFGPTGTRRFLTDAPACPGFENASVLGLWPTDLPDGGLTVVTACRQGDQQLGFSGNRFTVTPRGLIAQSPGSTAAVTAGGVVNVGQVPTDLQPLVLSSLVDAVVENRRFGRMYVTDRLYHRASRASGLGLEPFLSGSDPSVTVVATLPFGTETFVLRGGLTVDTFQDGGAEYLAGFPDGVDDGVRSATLVHGNLALVVAGDTLWSVSLVPGVPTLYQSRARPVPGFGISSSALVAHPDGGVFEGYLIAANRLFAVEALSINRVNTTEVALGADDPAQVYFDERGADRRGRLMLSSGAVLSLPQLVPLSEPLEGHVDVASVCSTAVQLTADGLAQLESPDGGTGTWSPLRVFPERDGGFGRGGRLLPVDGGIVISLQGGQVWHLPLSCH